MHAVLKTILQRVALGFATLALITLIIFASVEMLPGDFAQEILGQSATPEAVKALRTELGLDRPAAIRYFDWVTGALQGDFGNSLSGRGQERPVSGIISERLFNTFFLAGVTALVSIPFALVLGLLAALYRESWFDRVVNVVTLTAISAPEFFIAYILVLALAVSFPPDILPFLPLPSLANVSPDTSLPERLWRISLPVLTLALVITAYMMRMTRTAIVSILSEPYVEMARLKGVSRRRIIFHHALPNAWAPIANVIAFILAYLVVGVVVVEVVFVYPGVGQLMVDAVRTRDIPVVQASSLIFAGTFILLNLVADIVAIVTNPKLMHPR